MGEDMNKLSLGCHLSSTGGYLNMGKVALSIGATTFQFFTRNPQGGSKAKPLDLEDINAFNELAENNNFSYIIAHAPYTMNLAGLDNIREFGLEIIKDDLYRLSFVRNVYYNFHPGSHVKQGEIVGLNKIVSALNECVVSSDGVIVLLETMAGKGSELGRTFEEIKYILDRVNYPSRFGVTLDTCHVFDAGYDIKDNLDEVLKEFDRIIGLDRLKAIHLNDSKNVLGSRKDRHALLGEGNISLEALINFVSNKHIRNLPIVLETPNDIEGYAREIALIKEMVK